MMKSCLLLLALVLAVASAFAPIAVVPSQSTTSSMTTTQLGLFGGAKKKPEAGKKGGVKQEADVFAGRGKKVTIRQDEDNAMWIEEDSKGGRVKPGQAPKKGK
jgi:hypothetical protein